MGSRGKGLGVWGPEEVRDGEIGRGLTPLGQETIPNSGSVSQQPLWAPQKEVSGKW